ncbi:MAG: CotH kinase family protein [Flavobacteriales bacterium]
MRTIIVIALIFLAQFANGQVVINEVMSLNSSLFNDELGVTPDWIELFNNSSEEQNLSSWFLTDNEEDLSKWNFPNDLIMPPYSYIIILANGDNELETSLVQTNFKLKKSGETLVLSGPGLVEIDKVIVPCIPENRSYGRNAENDLTLFYVPSPAAPNVNSTQYELPSDEIILSHPPGLYNEQVDLSVYSLLGSQIKYSLDGTFPTEESPVVDSTFMLIEKYTEEGISHISSGPLWKEPQEPVFSGYNIKLMSFSEGCPSSYPVVADYFIKPQIRGYYPVPVYSLSFNEEDLLGDDGILAPGSTGENYLGRGDEWERRAYLQLFYPEGGLVLDQPVDLRIRGAGSRMNNQKSLKLYARDFEKHTSFDYALFSDRNIDVYKRLVLRSGHSDFTQTLVKDLLAAELAKSLNVEYMSSETSVVFMNGEYWGVQNARENMDKFYLESHFGMNPDSVEIIKFTGEELIESEGTSHHFQSVLDYAASNDLGNKEHYDWVTEEIDILNFIDYHISELFFSNWDWPKNNNKVWRSTAENTKFRWMLYDCDACFYRFNLNRLTDLDNSGIDVKPSFILLKNLLQNNGFRLQFQRRYLELISNEFSSTRVIQKIDSLESLLEPLILEHINRWSTPESYFSWKENLEEMKVFALQRPTYAISQLNQLFSNPVKVYPNPADQFLTVDTGIDQTLKIVVYNSNGQPVLKNSVWNGTPLFLEELTSGLYVMRIQLGDLSFTEKFFKQ